MAQLDQRQQNVVNEKLYTKNIMDAKTKVMNDLNTFNQKYAEYIKCNNTCANSLTVSNEYNTSVSNLKRDLDTYSALINPSSASQQKLKTYSEFNSIHGNVIITESENKRLRSELDAKLKEVYNINGTITTDGLAQYNSVIYTEILFTILATTLLYFTFTKL